MMIFRFTQVYIIFLTCFFVFTGCERTHKVITDSMVSGAISPSSPDMESTPVKLVTFTNYPEGGKDAYIQWIVSVASTLQAPEEIIRIRSYDNLDPSMRPDRMVEFEFANFIDMENYLNRPEIAAIFEEQLTYASDTTTHTFIELSDYAKEEAGDWKIKGVYLIDYLPGGKQAYLEWVASVSSILIGPDELKAIASYDNYYGESPHRLVTLEFASQADVDSYEQIEAVSAVGDELDTRTASWELHEFELRSDYINTGKM